LAFSTMLVPIKVILRPWRSAALATCCIREISEAKLAMMMRPGAFLKTSSKAGSITRSEGVHPGLSALVESASKASTPRAANSASLA
jgi:hypothetical protein